MSQSFLSEIIIKIQDVQGIGSVDFEKPQAKSRCRRPIDVKIVYLEAIARDSGYPMTLMNR